MAEFQLKLIGSNWIEEAGTRKAYTDSEIMMTTSIVTHNSVAFSWFILLECIIPYMMPFSELLASSVLLTLYHSMARS